MTNESSFNVLWFRFKPTTGGHTLNFTTDLQCLNTTLMLPVTNELLNQTDHLISSSMQAVVWPVCTFFVSFLMTRCSIFVGCAQDWFSTTTEKVLLSTSYCFIHSFFEQVMYSNASPLQSIILHAKELRLHILSSKGKISQYCMQLYYLIWKEKWKPHTWLWL